MKNKSTKDENEYMSFYQKYQARNINNRGIYSKEIKNNVILLWRNCQHGLDKIIIKNLFDKILLM